MRKEAILKLIKNLLFFIGLIFLTFYILFKNQDMNQLKKVIESADKKYIIIGIFFMLLYYITEAHNVRFILKALGDKKISIFKALKFTFIGFFFSSITPAATGGQPLEIYYMTKEKISGGNAALTLLTEVCGFLISTITFGIVCAIFNPNIVNGGLFGLFLLGLLMNIILLTTMMISIFSKGLAKKLVNGFIKILTFFKVKNLDYKKQRIQEGLDTYSESSKFIKTHKKEFIKSIIRVFVQIAFYYSIPYFVVKSFGINSYSFIEIFSMQAILYITVSSLPLPGAIGVSETVFLKIYGPVFKNKLLNGAMLLNRVITFYLYVVISLIVVVINAIKMKDKKGEIDEKVISYDLENSRL